MFRSKAPTGLLGLVDSDSDEDFGSSLVIAKQTMAAVRKAKGRPAKAPANRVMKPDQRTTRRTSGRIAKATENAEERQALAEKSSNQDVIPGATRRKANVKKAPATDMDDSITEAQEMPKPKGTRGRPKVTKATASEPSAPQHSTASASMTGKRGRKRATRTGQVPVEEVEIPETQQPEVMDIDPDEDTMEAPPSYGCPEPAASTFTATVRPSSAAGSINSDPSLRRRLGDLTRKYDSLDAKYRDLRDIAVRDAERNFDRLKKQTEEKTNSANELIKNLKTELATQTTLAREGQRTKKQLETSEAKADALQSKISELTASLSDMKAEIKTLSTKLAATRNTEVANVKVPGSAIKGSMASNRAMMNADSLAAAQVAQMKEDLYGDLTGLIVRGVKCDGGEDVFDCIQTGRNGTLHFKLAIANDSSSVGYDEAHFQYMPQLDPNRDQALIEMLPDYLVEEITFPRPHAAKFYSRVMRSLTERLD